MQRIGLIFIFLLFVCQSAYATTNTNEFINTNYSFRDSINKSSRDSLRMALGIPPNESLLNQDEEILKDIFFEIEKKHTKEHYYAIKDFLQPIFENIQLYARQQADPVLGAYIMYLKTHLNLDNLPLNIIERRFVALESLAKEEGLVTLLIRVKYLLGVMYTGTNRISKGFNTLFKALYIAEKNFSHPNSIFYIVSHIGLLAYTHEQYQLSKRYFKKAVDNKEFQTIGGYNNLALAYARLKMLDSANYYFDFAKQLAVSQNNHEYLIIINGNIGENLYLKGDFEAAIPLLKADANFSLTSKRFGNASNALIYLSACYLALDKPIESEQLMWEAYNAAKKNKELRRMKPIYKQLAKWYAYNEDASNTLLYSDSLQYVSEQLHFEFDETSGFEADKLVRLNASEVDLLEREKEQEISKRVIFIMILSSAFVTVIALLLFLNFRAKRLLKEKNLALANAQLTGELENARLKLNVYIKETQQKTLTEKVILTDADWREFLQYFNKVYPTFFFNLKQKFPILSKAEIRLCCLSYLSLSDKEMASMLGVGRASIRVTRGRARAKLQLKEGDSLETLLLSI